MLLLRPAHPLSQPPQPSFTSRADTHKSWTRFIWQVPSSLSPVGASRHLSVYTSSFPPCGGETISGMHQKRTRDQKMREHLRCSWRSLHWLTPVESQDRQILQPNRVKALPFPSMSAQRRVARLPVQHACMHACTHAHTRTHTDRQTDRHTHTHTHTRARRGHVSKHARGRRNMCTRGGVAERAARPGRDDRQHLARRNDRQAKMALCPECSQRRRRPGRGCQPLYKWPAGCETDYPDMRAWSKPSLRPHLLPLGLPASVRQILRWLPC